MVNNGKFYLKPEYQISISRMSSKFSFEDVLILCYFSSFISWFVQIDLLYSLDGGAVNIGSRFANKFVNEDAVLQLITLVGALLSLAILLFRRLQSAVTLSLLLVLYIQIYEVGGVFSRFQWDILLIEAGFFLRFLLSTSAIHKHI